MTTPPSRQPVHPYSAIPSPPPAGRRVFHLIAAGATTLLALALPERPYMLLLGGGALLSLALDAARPRIGLLNRLFLRLWGPILKESEATAITGATWFLIAAFFAFYFYGPQTAVPVLLFVAVGDPAAALVGARSPGPRFWGKSPAGAAAFIAAALAVWAVLSAAGFGGWSWAIVIAILVAAAVEIAPLPLDDNLTVPLISGAVLTLANAWTAPGPLA